MNNANAESKRRTREKNVAERACATPTFRRPRLDRTKCHQCGAAAYGTSAVADNLFSAIVHTTNAPPAPRAMTGERIHTYTRACAYIHTRAHHRTHNLADVRRATRPWPSFGGGKSVYILRSRTRTRAGGRMTAVGGGPGGRAPVVDGRNIVDGRLRGKPETSTAMTGPLSIALAFSPVVGGPR